MANRGKRTGVSAPQLEHEIERCRELEYWSKVEELAKKLKNSHDGSSTGNSSTSQFVTLGNFLTGEAKLEQFLLEHPPPLRSKPNEEAKNGLKEAKSCLLSTIGDEAKQLGVHLDSFILLGKLHFAEGSFKEAIDYYDRANIESLEEKQLPPRSLKIMAEAFAIKALCLEKIPSGSTSKNKINERENAIIKCYETSGDLTLLYLQVADRSETMGQSTWSVASAGTTNTAGSASPVPTDDNAKTPKERLSPILEAALYQAAKMHMKAGRTSKAISRWRSILMAEESDSTRDIRRAVCCQLAEALLHSCSDGKYSKPDPLEFGTSSSNRRTAASARFSTSTNESPAWRPKRANVANVFTPKNRYEEVVLALMLSEYIARKDAVLSQDPKFASERKRAYEAVSVTYDLIALSLGRFGQHKLLSDVLDRSMKFSFKQGHTWEQFSLALACDGKSYRALLVFQELASQLDDKDIDVGIFLSMARICYERLALFSTGLELAQRTLQSQAATYSKRLTSRCNLFVGLGYTLVARNVENQMERKTLLNKAEHYYQVALELDQHDHVCEYYLALHCAETRRPELAMQRVQRALQLNPEHLSSLQLLVLLLSGKKEYSEALEMIESVLEEYPDNLGLMTLKVRISEVVHGGEYALGAAKDMIHQWQLALDKLQAGEDNVIEINNASTPTMATGTEKILGGSVTEPAMGYHGARVFDAMSDRDSVSLHAHSMTASHIERTLSEVASSLSSQFPPKPGGGMDPTYSLMRIWLLCGELHLRQENIVEAEFCVQEAKSLLPTSYHLMYIRGLLHVHKREYEEARQCFENSLSINPSHVSSLFQLAKVYYQLAYNRLAEHTLKIAVRIDPVSEDIWSLLGLVTEALALEYTHQGLVPLESRTSRSGSLTSEDNEGYSDDEMIHTYRQGPTLQQPDFTKVESESTPTEETVEGFNKEAAKLYAMAAECHSIALSVQSSAPIVPFSSIPLIFE